MYQTHEHYALILKADLRVLMKIKSLTIDSLTSLKLCVLKQLLTCEWVGHDSDVMCVHLDLVLTIPKGSRENVDPKRWVIQIARMIILESSPSRPEDDFQQCQITVFLTHSEGGRWYSLPEELGECWEPREAERGPPAPGGDPPALRGDPGGRVSATDINAAMGD